MLVQSVINHDIMINCPQKAFPQFDTAVQTKVVIDFIIRRTVVKVDIPSPVAPEPVIPDHDRMQSVFEAQFFHQAVIRILQAPPPVAPPSVDTAMIPGFADRVKNITVIDTMPAEGSLR